MNIQHFLSVSVSEYFFYFNITLLLNNSQNLLVINSLIELHLELYIYKKKVLVCTTNLNVERQKKTISP